MVYLKNFLELGISETFNHTLRENGITEATPIQEKAIPVILSGKDIIGQAKTGTGKTLAFVLPILEKINPESSDVQALIVAPTRELALQITTEIKKMLVQREDINVLAIYGGQDVAQQLRKLKGNTHIVVATPGRLLDHIRRETIDLSNLSTIVLDEADQMLYFGFLYDIEDILDETPGSKQTMLFSATMPKDIKKLAKRYMDEPQMIQVQSEEVTVDTIEQRVIETTDRAKPDALRFVMDRDQPFLAVIFCRTKVRASKLYDNLKGLGYNCAELHGDIPQAKRERVMKSFREAKIQYLIATDVAARGLDVDGVTHVFNFDIPEDVESYIHRIGRTGRAGGSGLAITFVAAKDEKHLEEIEKTLGAPIQREIIEQPKIKRVDENGKPVPKPAPKKSGHRQRDSREGSRSESRRDSRNSSRSDSRNENNRSFNKSSNKKGSTKQGQQRRGR
ncbi:DEAD/DEAH box helicase [Bacillus thuringiensis]|uniref:DEAD/DEAH box helicase n=1 Tax=Bacillus thuringiensis TaxID=1428 RepID=UPI0007C1C028|nr:DEAD/DEAH box helicase [Bacillus thuringiensis]AND07936.1 RNA helicase [Bacillus thuringiensis serovar alesti]MEC3598360.1 DEAD/DEAH box helicase [Bacillus thuringiensis]MED1833236.1 DEAD/DEAH box helicase [Bacillus thuringiensis]MED2210200.1 DEAD/DEAH box helicase [Bacillus thuringiensis]MED2669707.1 DEAD/DEAH box helicase [Bacillus thuringiensis]